MPYVKICDVCGKEIAHNEGCSNEKNIRVTLPSELPVTVNVTVRDGLNRTAYHDRCYHRILRIAADNITPDGHA